MKITKILAIEVLDSSGNPFVKSEITLQEDATARGISPSGARTGEKEAVERVSKFNQTPRIEQELAVTQTSPGSIILKENNR